MTPSSLRALAAGLPAVAPTSSLVWTAAVTVTPRQALGAGPRGERFIVPITGGEFWGAPGHEALSGTVLAGGADRQTLRPDGVKELDALYEMQCHDGSVLTVHNQVCIDESVQPRYSRSVVKVSAPAGPHDWLNRRVLVGTLQPLQPERLAVVIRVWRVD
jgi:hypothetical protein